MIVYLLSLYIVFGADHAPCFIPQELARQVHVAAYGEETAIDADEEWLLECGR